MIIMIKAIIFDFDGLIVDTETPEFLIWQQVYMEYGEELTVEMFGWIIGGTAASTFRPEEHLRSLHPDQLDEADLHRSVQELSRVAIHKQPVLPGVLEHIAEAKRLGLHLAVASSSPHSWVDSHLQRVGLFESFDLILCRDDVGGIGKPDPALFNGVLDRLGLVSSEAIVLEDSPNGVLAANRAGIFVVAVPNFVTLQLDLSHADLVLGSLAEMRLRELVKLVENRA